MISPTETSAFSVAQPWHGQSTDEVLAAFDASLAGLSEQEAQKRNEKFGANRLPEPPRRSRIKRFLLQFHNILIYVLLGAAVITALLAHAVDTGVILAVVFVNAVIGYLQEGKAEKAMEAIRQMLAPRASVIRNGERRQIPGDSLVPGDIVLLEAGDKVPADIRLLKTHSLQIQEAILTGESVPVEKQTKPVAIDAALGDRLGMAYSSTLITSGQGTGVVVATGTATEIGRISCLLSEVEVLTTPLVHQMESFSKWLTLLILLVAGLSLGFGYFVQHHNFTDLFMAIVGLTVAAIPEGLPAVLTVTLAIGVQAMARRNAIVRRLPAIETLGSVSVICTDKTGTLTRNEMMVVSAITRDNSYTIEGIGYSPYGSVVLDGCAVIGSEHSLLCTLARAALLCNDAALHMTKDRWFAEGDPMEAALLAFAGKVGLSDRDERNSWIRSDVIPFDARHRLMATLNHNNEDKAYIFVKGAPERIIALCQEQQNSRGDIEPLNEVYWRERAEEIANNGQRVLALALRSVSATHVMLEHEDLERGMVLLGLVGLIDPPRPEAIAAVAECHSAGIRVKMITGDHAGTAVAIAKQIGLQNPDRVLTGVQLDSMDDFTLADTVMGTDIFARTSPEHKLRLVMALQTRGLVVAMTGDGVNDAPALKRADAGIAMGQKGSEAAKEAAELVLADDNFASIAAAVCEGRTVYDNIKKVISWTLPTSAGEAMTIIVALMLGMTLPITPVQILWVNLITAVTLGVALAFEPTEQNTMRRPPRQRDAPLLTGELVWHIVLVSILFLCGVSGMFMYATDRGYSIELARTMAMNTLVVMEIFHLFFIRNIHGTALTWNIVRGTKVIWFTIAVVTAAQFAITYLPFSQRIFATSSVPFFDGLLIVGVGVALFAVVEIEKQVRLRLRALT